MGAPALIGAVLAGGAARRMGGDKAGALLDGRPLAAWALDALRAAGVARAVVVAKRATVLPELAAERWDEPDEPRHPLAGTLHALERGGEAEVLTLPVDLPLVAPDLLRRLVAVELGAAPAAVVRAGGRLQPLVARVTPAARTRLAAAGRATDAMLALGPVIVEYAGELRNVNDPADLAGAEAALRARAR